MACLLEALHKDAAMTILLELQVLPPLQGGHALVQQVIDPLIVDLPQPSANCVSDI